MRPLFSLLLLIPLAFPIGDAVAQGADTETSAAATDERQHPGAVQVGAGTIAEATTGSSGGQDSRTSAGAAFAAGGTGQVNKPPVLSEICKDIADPAVLQQCREKAEQ